jgi:nitrogen fixation NifU-like protein
VDLDELYREVILDHNQNPRRRGHVEQPTVVVGLHNPTCGDQVVLELRVRDGVIEDIAFSGQGCSISMASASMLCEAVAGHSLEAARALAEDFPDFLTGRRAEPPPGEWEALAGVKKFPARVKCATLAHNALKKALADSGLAHGAPAGPEEPSERS